ncbi:MAG TPA: type II toxin-antitoxin system RelE/ParE family toxin [Desulfobacteraceae bacterium]|nr:type II toxin-antitoxin system RelE/ParE family toxin [Desulfobacteraceae bacterium]HPJ67041.1 type II toxin-antitoxin system RelE/ParE family toxin [Desulfobacteraceae bacterium]HPQ27119.1 type II toxin-antitoxin system RelE/ParE family toxin [Desulfobacteraceae bacterium]
MKIYQSHSFAKKVRKFNQKEKTELDNEIKKIAQDPSIGIEKKGDLKGIYVHKFRIKGTQHLISYRFLNDDLELIMIGVHENYYRNLKSYLKHK